MNYEQNQSRARISILGGPTLPQNARISDYHPPVDHIPVIIHTEPTIPRRIVPKGLPANLFTRLEGVTFAELHESQGELGSSA
jgi:hypothetical protein